MAEKNRTAKQTAALIIELIITLALCCACYFVYSKVNEARNELSYQNDRLEGFQSDFDEIYAEVEKVEKERDTYLSIDDSITGIKEEFFGYAAELEKAIIDGKTDQKIAYLTFDDGPYDLTKSFLSILESYDIQATFFELGKSVAFGKDVSGIYAMVKKAGHTIGNHTYSHRLGQGGIYRSPDAFMDDIVKNREFIQEKLGYTTEVMRFPGGSPTAGIYKTELINRLHDMGYGYVDWDVSCGDGTVVLTPSEYTYNILSTTNNEKIIVVLMHDYSENSCKALPDIIDGLIKQGYSFLPLWRGSSKVK